METTTLLQWVFGGGIAAGVAAAGIRLIQSLALKDQAQRADLSGNLSVIGNYGSFVERLTQANEALITQLKESQADAIPPPKTHWSKVVVSTGSSILVECWQLSLLSVLNYTRGRKAISQQLHHAGI
ncbi:hypothetical protein [Achromobacter phage ewik_TL4]|nr:hypothetical protein [Achromobacter phage ewik_TL4]